MLEAVEPVLDKETILYIDGVENQEGRPTKEEIKEYIEYSIKGGDKESFANFIAIIDKFKRDDKRFRRVTSLHMAAIKADGQYSKMYKEAARDGSELANMALQRLKWNQQNPS